MAIQNYLTNFQYDQDLAGVPQSGAIKGHGVRKSFAQNTINILSTDNIGSTYSILKNVAAEVVIEELAVETDALTSGQIAIGLYDSITGVALASTCFHAGLTLTSATTKILPADGLAALTHESVLQQLYLLAGATTSAKKGNYDVVATLLAASSTSGFVTFRATLIPSG